MKHRNSQFSTLNTQLFARRTACGLLAAGMCIMAARLCFAAEEDVIAVTERADGTANAWTVADAADALGLMNRKYWREMKTEGGRVAWHGAITNRVPIVDRLIILDYHADAGFVWTNAYTQADYDRAMKTLAGRVRWHGPRTLYDVNTNDLTVAETFADGFRYEYPWTVVTPEDSVEIANRKRLKAATLVNGLPAALRAARARRLAEISTVSNVTVTVETGM
ncbi:MAG: hypothetical protein IJ173_02105 [Kiritimatiellae bacterium]|nr:hypothetical protein [Kiritimatiellia bacterium]